jgi:hypothetical protein
MTLAVETDPVVRIYKRAYWAIVLAGLVGGLIIFALK